MARMPDEPIAPPPGPTAEGGSQCPECVEEARKEFRRGPGRPLSGGVSATKVLLVAIVAMYVVEMAKGCPGSLVQGPDQQTLFDLGAMQPLAIANGQYWRLFSAMFLHAGLLPIGFHRDALWRVGRGGAGAPRFRPGAALPGGPPGAIRALAEFKAIFGA